MAWCETRIKISFVLTYEHVKSPLNYKTIYPTFISNGLIWQMTHHKAKGRREFEP